MCNDQCCPMDAEPFSFVLCFCAFDDVDPVPGQVLAVGENNLKAIWLCYHLGEAVRSFPGELKM